MHQQRKFILFITFLFMTNSALADKIAENYLSNEKVNLTPIEKKALDIDKRWKNGDTKSIQPFEGEKGEIEFVYGTAEPKIVASPLKISDLILQRGEQISNVEIGDKIRWNIDASESGEQNEIEHVLIKPLDAGLKTNMVITTNKRTYHIALTSTKDQYMSKVSFIYPDDIKNKILHRKIQKRIIRRLNTIPETNDYLGNLDFEYNIIGKAPWKPIRVYNDGHKTIIQLPYEVEDQEAPILLAIERDGTFFKDPQTRMINYRLKNERYIVDSVFDKAMLIKGVGNYQEKIIIERK